MENARVRAILKPHGYNSHREFGIKEKLFDYEKSPIIAYGVDMGTHINYEDATDQDDLALKLSEKKKLALDNIASIPVVHSVQLIEGEKLFIVDPHEYAAEKILDKKYLEVVANELGNESFLVGIPHQGVFAAISSMSKFKGKFIGFIKQKFENPEANPITPHVFEIFNGEIVAVAGEDIGESKNTISQKSNGDLIVELESESFEEFTSQVSNGYTQAMLLGMKSESFSGNIIFNENNESFEFNETVLAKCRSYVQQITTNEMAQTISQALSGNGIVPSFTRCGHKVDLDFPQNSSIDNEKPKKKKWWQFGK